MNKKLIINIRRCVAIVVALTMTIDPSFALAPLSFTNNPQVKRKVYAALEGTRVMSAESPYAKGLLEANRAEALLLSSGKYLMDSKLVGDDVGLLRKVVHEDIEALLQVLYYRALSGKDDRYPRIKELILNHFPPEGKIVSEQGYILYVNDTLASAFEWLVLLADGVITEKDISPDTRTFLEKISPVIASRTDLFTAEFWNMAERKKTIKRALSEGMRFYQATSLLDKAKQGLGVQDDPVDVAEIVKFHNAFQKLVDDNEIGTDSPEGYRVALRDVIRVADIIIANHEKIGAKESLAWALREVYYKRLRTDADKSKVYNIIKNMKNLGGADTKAIFTNHADNELEISFENAVLRGVVNGKKVVEQKILGEVDMERVRALNMVMDNDTIKELIDLLFFSSQEKLAPVFLMGPTATGKTSKIRFLSALVGKEFLRVQFNSQTDELDLLGHFMPRGITMDFSEAAKIVKEYLNAGRMEELKYIVAGLLPLDEEKEKARVDPVYVREKLEHALAQGGDKEDFIRAVAHVIVSGSSGVELYYKKAHFLEALERGDWILLDELNLAGEESLGILYGLLTRGYIEFAGKRIYPKKNGGMIFAAGNLASDEGRNIFSEALENRFQIFYMPPMSDEKQAAILKEKYPISGISAKEVESLVKLNRKLVDMSAKGELDSYDGEREYPFTIRNLENILKNTADNLSGGKQGRDCHEILLLETFVEYSDILKKSADNIIKLRGAINSVFGGNTGFDLTLPENSYKEGDAEFDGLALPAPADRAKIDPKKVPDKDLVDLILTDTTQDTMRAVLYGFRSPGRPVMLMGQTATGKTDTIANTARILGWQYHSENLRDTPLASLVGNWKRNPATGLMDFKDGVLIEAMKSGYCLVLEEINFMDTGLLEVISEWIDEGYFTNPKTHERVSVHPDFRLFATLNPRVGNISLSQGRNTLPAPFINRFKVVWVKEKTKKEYVEILERMFAADGIGTAATGSDSGINTKELVDFHFDFMRLVGKSTIGTDSPEGYRVSTRELIRVERFIKEHCALLGARRALLWALKEIYYNRAVNNKDKGLICESISRNLKLTTRETNGVFHVVGINIKYSDDKKRLIVSSPGGTLIEHPVLGEVDGNPLESKKIVLDEDTRRELADLMFFSSQKKLVPVFLMGPTATGKTTKVRYLSSLVGKRFLRVQINSQTDEMDLLGHFMPRGMDISYEEAANIVNEYLRGERLAKLQQALSVILPRQEDRERALSDPAYVKEKLMNTLYLKEDKDFIRAVGYILMNGTSGITLEFKKAHFLEALERGDWILLDEVNLAREESLGVLYGLLSRGYLDFEGRRIYPKENGGMIFAAGNPASNAGREMFSEALENRFQVMQYQEMKPERLAEILCKKIDIPGLDIADITRLVTLNKALDQGMRSGEFAGFDTETLYPFTIRNIENILLNVERRVKWDHKIDVKEAFKKEMFIEYKDMLARSEGNVEILLKKIRDVFGSFNPPAMSLNVSEDGLSLDGLYFPGQKDTANQDKSRIPTDDMVDLVFTNSCYDSMRAVLYGFRNPRRPVMLVGQTAGGKTDIVANTAKLLEWQYHSENMRDTPLSSLVGTWARDPKTGLLAFRDGVLIEAMKKGYCLVLEEINFMETGLLEVISEWIDEGYFTNPKTHERVAIHPDFRLFATLNPIQGNNRMSVGRRKLPEPFINRFKIFWVNEKSYEEQLEILKTLFERYGVNPKLADDVVKFHNQFVQLVRNNVIGQESPEGYSVSLRELIRVAEFMKDNHKRLGDERALAWALREMYFLRLHTQSDKDKVGGCLVTLSSLKDVNHEELYSVEQKGEIETLTESFGYAGAMLKFYNSGKLPLSAQELINIIVGLLNDKEAKYSEYGKKFVRVLPAKVASDVFSLIDDETKEYLNTIGEVAAKTNDEAVKQEVLKKLMQCLWDNDENIRSGAILGLGKLAASMNADIQNGVITALKEKAAKPWDIDAATALKDIAVRSSDAKIKTDIFNYLIDKYIIVQGLGKDSNIGRIGKRIQALGEIAASLPANADKRKYFERLFALKDRLLLVYYFPEIAEAIAAGAERIASDTEKTAIAKRLMQYVILEA
ncbi:MAG: AAA family ATPase [Candidatus Omnitrophica bacterium]|nr:AAA family ATPase [Candidatus Omnitrophota bacterium]